MIATRALRSVPRRADPHPVLDDVDHWLKAKGTRFKATRDQVLFREGDDALSFYRIVSGAVRIVKVMVDGRRCVVDFLLPGDLAGFDSASTYFFTAEAMVDTEWIRYSRAALDSELHSNPEASRHLLELALQRIAAAQSQMLLLGRMNAMERIATFLLNLELRLGTTSSGARVITLPMTRLDIADHLGLTLETVSRLLNQLKRLAIIELPHPQKIAVLVPDGLERIASGACADGCLLPPPARWHPATATVAADRLSRRSTAAAAH